MKKYIIVGNNNFWYSSFKADNDNDILEEITDVETRINNKEYEDNSAETLYVYEANEILRQDIK